MRAGIVVKVTRDDRRRLEAIVADRGAPQKHVWRANIILATADGCGTTEIMRRSGRSKPVVWAWQARFMAEGVAGLLRDKTRKPGKAPLLPSAVKQVVDLALAPAPGETTHWTGRMLAKAPGVSLWRPSVAPAAVFLYSPDRASVHPERHLAGYAGISSRRLCRVQ